MDPAVFTATLSESDVPVVSAIDDGGFGPSNPVLENSCGRVYANKRERGRSPTTPAEMPEMVTVKNLAFPL